jgi:hypothetical protein
MRLVASRGVHMYLFVIIGLVVGWMAVKHRNELVFLLSLVVSGVILTWSAAQLGAEILVDCITGHTCTEVATEFFLAAIVGVVAIFAGAGLARLYDHLFPHNNR